MDGLLHLFMLGYPQSSHGSNDLSSSEYEPSITMDSTKKGSPPTQLRIRLPTGTYRESTKSDHDREFEDWPMYRRKYDNSTYSPAAHMESNLNLGEIKNREGLYSESTSTTRGQLRLTRLVGAHTSDYSMLFVVVTMLHKDYHLWAVEERPMNPVVAVVFTTTGDAWEIVEG
ncbi:hypothetical protein BT63DRAFT_452376 [Microthyrium microscopicum]|uniref:Uncharacterized protein n=1 Tax=Microthyrium microscopicum TaxID=703497 RepID=A0A6A6UI54_9PEZI|nr:hypothetical protein BT63DRAFT_452376 [Microthyrium microscopicum]